MVLCLLIQAFYWTIFDFFIGVLDRYTLHRSKVKHVESFVLDYEKRERTSKEQDVEINREVEVLRKQLEVMEARMEEQRRRTREVQLTPIIEIFQPPKASYQGREWGTIDAPNFELKPGLIRLVQANQFGGEVTEDPNDHLYSFLEICDTLKIEGVPNDTIRMRLFGFSLRDRAKEWFKGLNGKSIKSWEDLCKAFLSRYFPPSKVQRLISEIYQFSQHEDETIFDAWERFRELLRKCPPHGLDESRQIFIFYGGLSSKTRTIVDATSGGCLLNRDVKEARRILEEMVSNSFQWPMERVNLKKDTSMLDDKYEELASQITNLKKEHEEIKKALIEARAWQRPKNGGIFGQEEAIHINQQPLSIYQQLVEEEPLQPWSYEASSMPLLSMPFHEIQDEEKSYAKKNEGTSLTLFPQTSIENDEFGGEKRYDLVESTPHEEVVEMSIDRLEEFKKLDVNSSLVELLRTMPNHEKFLEDVDKRKMRMDDDMTIELSEGCSARLQREFPNKESDLGDFTITCEIGDQVLEEVLCDMGSRVNVMPLPIFESLKIGTLMPTMTILKLADRSIIIPWGKVDNVLIKVGKFIFPVDFFVLDVDEEHNIPLILGMPFLSTSRAILDVCDGSLTFQVDEEEMTFYEPEVENGLKIPTKDEDLELEDLPHSMFVDAFPYRGGGFKNLGGVKFQEKVADPLHERFTSFGGQERASFDVP